jgi:ankyrin repeat protein
MDNGAPKALMNAAIEDFNSTLNQMRRQNIDDPCPELWQKVLGDLSRILENGMFREHALSIRARALYYSGKYEEAIADIDAFYKEGYQHDVIIQGDFPPKRLRAMAKIKLNRFSEAESDLLDEIATHRQGLMQIYKEREDIDTSIYRSNDYYWLLVCKHKGDRKAASDEHSGRFDKLRRKGEMKIQDAAKVGDINKVKELINSNGTADINELDGNGMAALHWASSFGHVEIATLLISNGAQVNLRNKYGGTPIHLATWEGCLEIVKLLLDYGDYSTALLDDDEGRTPLHNAAQRGFIEIGKLLLSKGASVYTGDYDSWTPLHRAAYNGHKEMVELLLTNESYIDVKNKYGMTPLQMANEKGYNEIVQVLQAKAK